MKITKTQLKQIIKEELGRVLNEEIPKSMIHPNQKKKNSDDPKYLWGVALFKVLRDGNAFRPERGLPADGIATNIEAQLKTMLASQSMSPQMAQGTIANAIKAGEKELRWSGSDSTFQVPDGFGDYAMVQKTKQRAGSDAQTGIDVVLWINEKAEVA
jgi:hypothetical protein